MLIVNRFLIHFITMSINAIKIQFEMLAES